MAIVCDKREENFCKRDYVIAIVSQCDVCVRKQQCRDSFSRSLVSFVFRFCRVSTEKIKATSRIENSGENSRKYLVWVEKSSDC